ncbi:unnamed protein product [Linum trigynum]|uniref:Uncharacterized protein n=1 Tax=Linum trigynum TaxID=586398 RepID=A0AAV2CL18_9ROSI
MGTKNWIVYSLVLTQSGSNPVLTWPLLSSIFRVFHRTRRLMPAYRLFRVRRLLPAGRRRVATWDGARRAVNRGRRAVDGAEAEDVAERSL